MKNDLKCFNVYFIFFTNFCFCFCFLKKPLKKKSVKGFLQKYKKKKKNLHENKKPLKKKETNLYKIFFFFFQFFCESSTLYLKKKQRRAQKKKKKSNEDNKKKHFYILFRFSTFRLCFIWFSCRNWNFATSTTITTCWWRQISILLLSHFCR